MTSWGFSAILKRCVEGLKSVNLLLSSHRFSWLVQVLKPVTSLTSMSHFSPWTMQTVIHLVVFLLVLSLCHAAWGCLILLDMGHLPTLLSLSGSMMPIFTSEWGRESMHISSPHFPYGSFQTVLAQAAWVTVYPHWLVLTAFFLQGWVT